MMDSLASEPVRVIFDTDISSDVDDAGAVAVLHALANRGEVEILAMMVSSGDPWSAHCLHAYNHRYGRAAIPVGAVRGSSVVHDSKYTMAIAGTVPRQQSELGPVPDAVTLYRQILAAQADGSVTVISVGYLTNLARLLESPADAFCPLDGLALVRQKVRQFVCMGGEFPFGREWNFYQDASAARLVVKKWPTPVVFAGFEVGREVLTGARLVQGNPGDPVRKSYELYNNLTNRSSWDQVAVLFGVAGKLDGLFAVSAPGCNIVEADGSNHWEGNGGCQHSFVKISPASIPVLREQIDTLMLAAANAPMP